MEDIGDVRKLLDTGEGTKNQSKDNYQSTITGDWKVH